MQVVFVAFSYYVWLLNGRFQGPNVGGIWLESVSCLRLALFGLLIIIFHDIFTLLAALFVTRYFLVIILITRTFAFNIRFKLET